MGDVLETGLLPGFIFGIITSRRKRHTRDERRLLDEGKISQPTGRSLQPEAIYRTFAGYIVTLLLFFLFLPNALAQIRIPPSELQSIQQGKSNNNGQDPTNTLPRFDFRYQYRNLPTPTHTNDEAHVFTFRADDIFRLSDRWRVSGRLEVPLAYTNLRAGNNATSPDSADRPFRFGTGEVVTQVLGIYDIDARTALAFGTQFIFPTASPKDLGANQYLLVPTLVASWQLPEISLGSFFAPIVRYNFDIARSSGGGHTSELRHTSELQFSPTMNIMLPDRWFVTLFPGTTGGDIRYNLEQRQREDKGRLFLPANFMVGKLLGGDIRPDMVASLEIGIPIINDYKRPTLPGTYNFRIEARIGFFW